MASGIGDRENSGTRVNDGSGWMNEPASREVCRRRRSRERFDTAAVIKQSG